MLSSQFPLFCSAVLATLFTCTLSAPVPNPLTIDITITDDSPESPPFTSARLTKDPPGYYCPRPGRPTPLECEDDQIYWNLGTWYKPEWTCCYIPLALPAPPTTSAPKENLSTLSPAEKYLKTLGSKHQQFISAERKKGLFEAHSALNTGYETAESCSWWCIFEQGMGGGTLGCPAGQYVKEVYEDSCLKCCKPSASPAEFPFKGEVEA